MEFQHFNEPCIRKLAITVSLITSLSLGSLSAKADEVADVTSGHGRETAALPPFSAVTANEFPAERKTPAAADFHSLLQQQLRPDTLTTSADRDGHVVLNNKLQRLNAEISTEGVRYVSIESVDTVNLDSATGISSDFVEQNAAFSLQLEQIGRAAEMTRLVPGQLQRDGDKVALLHDGLREEFSNSPDGIRQDFIISLRPAGDGPLQLLLHSSGARFTTGDQGLSAHLDHSDRVLTYDRLKVLDASGQVVSASMQVQADGAIAISVADAQAVYPLTIDPTVSDAHWTVLASYAGNGIYGSVEAMVIDANNNIYVGGWFGSAGDILAARVAKWDGHAWTALGTGMHSDEWYGAGVDALALDSAGNLYAGGLFEDAGGVPANNIAKWDGHAWSALDRGFSGRYKNSGRVNVLLMSSNGTLYAGGDFNMAGSAKANHIAKWDGHQWSALGKSGGGVQGSVLALTLDQQGALYVGGYFRKAGGKPACGIAKWDGQDWSGLGSGVPIGGIVFALRFDHAGNLFVGGRFSQIHNKPTNNIAKWDGHHWSPLGVGVDEIVRALSVDADGVIYAAGYFHAAGELAVQGVAKWDGQNWSALGSGVGYGVSLATDNTGKLLVGGQFSSAGGIAADNIAQWNGTDWRSLGDPKGFNGAVDAMVVDSAGNLYVGGDFTVEDRLTVNHIAKWNGHEWLGLGDGVNGKVYALALDLVDNLYVGGKFNIAGSISANDIAKWDGHAWSALGVGMAGADTDYQGVHALAFDSRANLYAGGYFTMAGNVAANNIAKWDGQTWSTLGSGILGRNAQSGVRTLAVDNLDHVIAGGMFSTAGGFKTSDIAKWDGHTWSALGLGLGSPTMEALVDGAYASVFDRSGILYVGGHFETSDGTYYRLAKWDGKNWSVLGSGGRDAYIYALAVDGNNELFAGGITPALSSGIMKWDGQQWLALTHFGAGSIHAVTVVNGVDLLVGGNAILGKAGRVAVARLDSIKP